MNLLKPVLAAFVETTKMTHHTTFFKTDRLAAFRTLLPQKAGVGLAVLLGGISG